MFLGLQDPDPEPCKNSKKNLDFLYFVTLFDFLSLKNDVNVPSKSNKQKNCVKNLFIAGMLKANDENSRIRIQDPDPDPGSGSGSISQRYGSEDPDPDPPQNVMDPEHWLEPLILQAWTADNMKSNLRPNPKSLYWGLKSTLAYELVMVNVLESILEWT
jgi:hypothetical protein